ncbi:MAG: DNA polymerase III subunit chi [Acidiferrobacteraceae bacterium]
MTSIDFYLLSDPAEPADRVACRLAEKIYRLGHRVYLLVADRQQAEQLDQLLWTFSQGSFVPHEINGTDAPICIGDGEPPEGFVDVMVNLAGEVPGFFSRFDRVAELVGASEDAKQAGRERYRFYRDRGYALNTHNL